MAQRICAPQVLRRGSRMDWHLVISREFQTPRTHFRGRSDANCAPGIALRAQFLGQLMGLTCVRICTELTACKVLDYSHDRAPD